MQAFRQWYSARARSGQSRGSRAEQRAQFEAWYARRQHGAQPSGPGITDESVEGVDTLFGESAEG